MNGSRAALLARKRDLYASIRMLEQDFEDGMIDAESYRHARSRYETEAADILQRMDAMPRDEPHSGAGRSISSPSSRSTRVAIAVSGALVAVAIPLLLVSAIHGRSTTAAISVRAPAPPTVSPVLASAQRNARAHPHDVSALLELGNAYLHSGQAAAADRSYVTALKVNPGNPLASTLHAMVVGSTGQYASALRIVRGVERAHPSFARAWLLDGLFAGRTRGGYRESIAAWRHFLRLQPHGAAANQVRQLIAVSQRAARATGRKGS